MSKRFLCLWCNGKFDTEKEILSHKHPCDPNFRMMNGTITVELSEMLNVKRTRWDRFKDRFFELDISYGLAIMGLIVINWVFIRHLDLTFWEALFEGLGVGFAAPRLVK